MRASLNKNNENKDGFTHIDSKGSAHMVDVSNKNITSRVAIASSEVIMEKDTLDLIQNGGFQKGDVLGVSRIAGIMAAKKCSELIPMCHPLNLNQVDIFFEENGSKTGVIITATVKVSGKTGVEIEAITAASIAAITIYDMCKSKDRSMEILRTRLIYKNGGKSGEYQAK
ncbi:MAG: cyclic pyranopterin monophosphate synthase MoaC [Chloroflexi bacterium]|nr:cyclic pyranopterin monophosphate synthase MoaC [Chloroflexota bacterium]|tara:strand:- start:388 stop:897 length:510 start_codon:yes stop_codon:yes gene_type:complete